MNPDVFFENFELLADAPNGVQKLRELILQLAVMGKLVPQDPNDEPASVLIEKIKAEKRKLGQKEKSKGSKKLPEISGTEVLFEIPKSWKWIRFDDICSYIQRGKSPKYVEESDFPVIAQKCIQWDGLKIDRAKFIDPLTIEKYEEERFLRTGDLLWNSTGTGTIGRVNVYAHEENTYDKVVADTHVTVVRPLLVDSCYIYCWIASPIVQRNIENIASGSTNQIELATSTVKSHILPLPPFDEQKRIVSKVNELMALCDKLEYRRQKKQEIQGKLNSAALDRMLSAENQEEFEQHWQHICENFDLLYDNPENVEKLKKYILQLGIEGKLVPTESEIAKNEGRDYESADSLLKSILINRGEKETNCKNKNNVESIELSNTHETLPEGWIWTSIGQVTECLDHMRIPVNKKEREERVGKIPYYGANGRVGWIDNYIFDEPLVLVVEDETFIGRQKPFCYKIVGKSWVNNHAHVLRPTEAVDVDFLNYSLAYYPFIPLTSGTTGRKKLNKSTLIAAPYKLPPLEEQKRIVEKVEQLMGLCDELKAKLRKEREDSEKLMEMVIKGMLEGTVA